MRVSLGRPIPMRNPDLVTIQSQPLADLLGNRDGPMLAARASDGDRHRVLVVRPIQGEYLLEHGRIGVKELTGTIGRQHVCAHRLVKAGQGTQFRYPMRVGEEPDIGHEVGV